MSREKEKPDPALLARRVRRSLGVDASQDEFARRMGVTKASVQNWESGRGRPKPATLRKMAELAPDFRAEISVAIEAYEHHRSSSRQSNAESGLLDEISGYIPAGIRKWARNLAEQEKKTLAQLYAELITSAVEQSFRKLAPRSSTPHVQTRPHRG